jgi:hypothetical protein
MRIIIFLIQIWVDVLIPNKEYHHKNLNDSFKEKRARFNTNLGETKSSKH